MPSFKEIYELNFFPMYKYALLKVGVREDAEDICADVFVKFNSVQEKIEDPRKWLFTALKNKVIDHFRAIKHWIDVDSIDLTDEVSESPMDSLLPLLFAEIEHLTPARRKVLEMSAIGMNLLDIASKLGISYQSVRNEKLRGMNDLRKIFINSKPL